MILESLQAAFAEPLKLASGNLPIPEFLQKVRVEPLTAWVTESSALAPK